MLTVSAFYKFFPFPGYIAHRAPLKRLMQAERIKGTILLASEGINGTVAGSAEAIAALHHYFSSQHDIGEIAAKESHAETMPFVRAKVRLKKELISLGAPANPNREAGKYVPPAEWNALISQPDTIVLDARNDYEVEVGTFLNARNPETKNFKQLPGFVRERLPDKSASIATFCTGGIRCEKLTAYLKEQGYEHVYHLQGGILKYLEEIPKEESLWQGECFVFDEREAVGHGLAVGKSCHPA